MIRNHPSARSGSCANNYSFRETKEFIHIKSYDHTNMYVEIIIEIIIEIIMGSPIIIKFSE